MRFLIGSMCFISSVGMIAQASVQEKRLHRKLLQSIQSMQISIARNDALDERQNRGAVADSKMVVRLVLK